MRISKVWKAVFGAVGALAGALATAALDDLITLSEVFGVVATVIATASAVYFAPKNQE